MAYKIGALPFPSKNTQKPKPLLDILWMDLRNIDKQALAWKCQLKVIKEEIVLLWVGFFFKFDICDLQ